MNDLVRQLATDSGVLRHVSGRRSPAGYELLELGFDRGTLRPTCDADTDEIVVEAIGQEASEVGEIPDDGALASLLGKAIEQAWTMVNDRGYKDAFQIRCLDLATRSQSCVQFCNHSCSRQRLIARSCLQTQRPRPSIHRGWYTRCCTASGSPNPPDPIRDIQPTPAGQSIALRCSNMPGVLRISDEVVYRGIERHDRAFANSREYRSSERVPLGLLGGFAPDECVPWPSPTRPNPPYPQNQPFPTGVPALLLNGDLDVVSLEDAKAALPLFPSGTRSSRLPARAASPASGTTARKGLSCTSSTRSRPATRAALAIRPRPCTSRSELPPERFNSRALAGSRVTRNGRFPRWSTQVEATTPRRIAASASTSGAPAPELGDHDGDRAMVTPRLVYRIVEVQPAQTADE